MSRDRPLIYRWPFYRPRLSEETIRTAMEVRKLISIGYDPCDDPESPYYRYGSEDPRWIQIDYGDGMRRAVVEMPAYLRGRKIMAEKGADIADLDHVVISLLREERLPDGKSP